MENLDLTNLQIMAYTILTAKELGIETKMHNLAMEVVKTGKFELFNTISFSNDATEAGKSAFLLLGGEVCERKMNELINKYHNQ